MKAFPLSNGPYKACMYINSTRNAAINVVNKQISQY